MGEAPIDVQKGLDRYRAVRQQLEEQVLPLATSVDGRRFSYQASLHGLALLAGSYVTLEQGSERRLGQIVTLGVGQRQGIELGLERGGRGRAPRAGGDPGRRGRRPDPERRRLLVPRRGRAPGDAGRGPRAPRGDRSAASTARDRRVAARRRRPVRARRRRLRPPHVPLRPVGLREDVFARRRARAAAARDRPADRRARPELGLRPSRRAAGGRGRRRRRPLCRGDAFAERAAGRRRPRRAVGRARSGDCRRRRSASTPWPTGRSTPS